MSHFSKFSLLATAATLTLAVAAPAFAQAGSPNPDNQNGSTTTTDQAAAPITNGAAQEAATADQGSDVVVTGSILRRTDLETPSPVTVLSAESLNQRGQQTAQDAIQQLTSNNGPALTNSFTANGAFAGGASAVSLRGLSTNSTLVLFDGLRAAYYPLADDGSRNFVDLNTIPDEIIDRIEVLRDGASSSYGADAIAGVVNIITKREFKGIGGRVEAGISQDGVNANQRLNFIAGTGDLDDNGYNAYVSGFYLHQAEVENRDLPYPFNTSNESGVCSSRTGSQVCGPNNIFNARQADGSYTFALPYDFYVRPYTNVGYSNGVQNGGTVLGRYQKLNPNSACVSGSSIVPNAADLAANPASPTGTVCQIDPVSQYLTVSPKIERFGGSARFTGRFGDNNEAYLIFNFQQSRVSYDGVPPTIRGQANTGILFPPFTTAAAASAAVAPGSGVLALPVYVCASGINCDTAADRRLNPNNPFAAQGQIARLTGRPTNEATYNETRSRVYRVAAAVQGTILGDWDYRVDLTAMHTDLRRTSDGYVYIQNLLNVIGNGTYNFVNPELNSQAIRDYLTPVNITDASSDLYMAQATLGKALFQLPGGPLQLGIGASIRHEGVDAPSANADTNGPTQRYFTLNAFGTSGTRRVYSAFAELNAPIVDQFEVNASGRYDRYSSGQDAFSPKVGAKFKPIKELAIRGTYSRGFRIPSFGESNALPTTGYVNITPSTLPNAFLAQYSTPATATTPARVCSQSTVTNCPTYITANSYGLTTLASPDLRPEKSRSFTGGIIFEPIRNVTITADYFNIRKTGAITGASTAPALAAYYAGQAIPAGFTVTPAAVDPNFPNAQPVVGFVASQLVNSDTIKSEGIDGSITARFDVSDSVRFTTSLDASYILELSTTFPNGTKERYDGTLGNYNLTAGSGTPKWRGSWQNTLNVDPFTLSATANYFGGYNLSAEDQTGPGTRGDCSLAPDYSACDVRRYITLDMVGSVKVADRFTFYVNVLNVLNDLPDVDAVTYGAYLYNPVQAGNGIFGRQFRAGVRIGL